MKQQYAFPRVSTRGYYDLRTGNKLKNNDYFLYPKYKLDRLKSAKEVVIFVHGMRNSRWGAIHGARLLRNRLRKLSYKYPVIAFSYDADVRGAHLEKNYHKVLETATGIAIKNGCFHLAHYIKDLKDNNPKVKIHLVGHSLGCLVVKGASLTTELFIVFPDNIIESVHLFGSPLEREMVKDLTKYRSIKKLVNYYNPTDEVIKEGIEKGDLRKPSCLFKPNIKYNKRC